MHPFPAACPLPLDVVKLEPALRLVCPSGGLPAAYRVRPPLGHASHRRLRTARARWDGGRYNWFRQARGDLFRA